jgi:mannose-6-phosphate isomerase-like protein (cupin superfamily)
LAHVVEMNVWAPQKGRWHGELQGAPYAAGISLIFNATEKVGFGPRLHQHPYAETFIIRKGRALFTVGGAEIKAGAGQIVIVPADTPHKFKVIGPGVFESIDIHASESFVTEWLE